MLGQTVVHIVFPATCPHCGHLVAVGVNEQEGHVIARCDDAQDGGCNKPFVVNYRFDVRHTTVALQEA